MPPGADFPCFFFRVNVALTDNAIPFSVEGWLTVTVAVTGFLPVDRFEAVALGMMRCSSMSCPLTLSSVM
jgi:hypothetical protein